MQAAPGYEAAIGGAAVFDNSSRGKIAVAGVDRRTYLHAMLTNDVETLEQGSGCYAAYLVQQGRMIADMTVLELGDLVLLDLDGAAVAEVLKKLDQFVFSEDVQLGDLTAAFAKFTVAGPAAARLVADVLRADGGPREDELAAWPEFRNRRATYRGDMVLVAATRALGVPGFDLYVEAPKAAPVNDALLAAGAVPADAATAEVLRIESGRPLFGAEMDAETIPLEAGIEGRAISFTKGCYPGQEVIVRVVHRGQGRVARRIVGLRVDGDVVPARGDGLKSAERESGRVTSAAWSPRAGSVVALAMVHRDAVEPGTRLTVRHADLDLAAVVVPLPFVPV